MAQKFRAAISEITWLLNSGGAELGFRAQSYEPASFGGDPDASSRALDKLSATVDGKKVLAYRRYSWCFDRLSPRSRNILTAAFQSRNYDVMLASQCGKIGDHGTLAGVVLMTPAARSAFAERNEGRMPDGLASLAFWLASVARKDGREKVFTPLVRAARKLVEEEALPEYERLMVERAQAEAAAKAGWLGRTG